MGFEVFAVRMSPGERFALSQPLGPDDLTEAVRAILEARPDIVVDEALTASCRKSPGQEEMAGLVHEAGDGLFELFVSKDRRHSTLWIWAEFALANPSTVDDPFLGFVEWAMRHFGLRCEIASDLAPEQDPRGHEFEDPDALRTIAPPAIAHGRWGWHQTVGTEETAVLRPNEALARYLFDRP